MTKTRKQSKKANIDKGQPTLFDFAEDILSEEEKKEINQILEPQIRHISHENHIEDSTFLRSEQIVISKDNYPTISNSDSKESIYKSIDNISRCNHYSKNIYNQCLYQIRQSFFNKIGQNVKNEKEKKLRIDIKKELDKCKNTKFEDLKNKNYKNQIYKLLDKYFKDQSKNRTVASKDNDNYSWSPQAARQTCAIACNIILILCGIFLILIRSYR